MVSKEENEKTDGSGSCFNIGLIILWHAKRYIGVLKEDMPLNIA